MLRHWWGRLLVRWRVGVRRVRLWRLGRERRGVVRLLRGRPSGERADILLDALLSLDRSITATRQTVALLWEIDRLMVLRARVARGLARREG